MLIYGHLPTQELVDSKSIAAAGLVEGQEPAANGRDDLRLATDDPAPCGHWRQIGDRQRTPVGADDIFDTRTIRLGHIDTHTLEQTRSVTFVGDRL